MIKNLEGMTTVVSALSLSLCIVSSTLSGGLRASKLKVPTATEKPVEFNVVWENLKYYQPLRTYPAHGQIVMTLSGTVIKTQLGDIKIFNPTKDPKALLDVLVYGGGPIEVLSCRDSRCIEIEKKMITIPQDQSLCARFERIIPGWQGRIHIEDYKEGELHYSKAILFGVLFFLNERPENWKLVLRKENAEILAKAAAFYVAHDAQVEALRAYKDLVRDPHIVNPWNESDFAEWKAHDKALSAEMKAKLLQKTVQSTEKNGGKS